MNEFLEAFDGYVVPLAVVVIALLFRRPLSSLFAALRDRVSSGSGLTVEAGLRSFTLEPTPLVVDTGDAQQRAQQQGQGLEVFGNPDQLILLFKVQGTGWKKSTKALQVPGGCLVQMTTERQSQDGSWDVGEALQFVPGVEILPDSTGQGHSLGVHQ